MGNAQNSAPSSGQSRSNSTSNNATSIKQILQMRARKGSDARADHLQQETDSAALLQQVKQTEAKKKPQRQVGGLIEKKLHQIMEHAAAEDEKKKLGVAKGGASGLMISLLLHAGAFVLAGLLVVFTVVSKEEKTFAPPKPVERPKMKLKKPKVKWISLCH